MKKDTGLIKWLLVLTVMLGVGLLNAASAELGSGTCGANLTWVLSDDGVLTISGTGEMSSNLNVGAVPWYQIKNDIKTVEIETGVASIGGNAFSGCINLTRVTIPESVKSIGYQAFEGCGNLTDVSISEGLDSIGVYAFNECRSLTSIILPESVKNISHRAFTECSSLTSITIPGSVTSIGDATFSGCTSLTRVTIPGSVSSIGIGAFWNCRSLESITIPGNVTVINGETFMNCERLTYIIIPENVTKIDFSAFCGCSSLTRVIIPDSVTFIGDSAFSGCSSLTSVTIPDSVTFIGEYAFDYDTVIKVHSMESAAYEWAVSNNHTRISDTIIYNKTAGNPIGEPKRVCYSSWYDSAEAPGAVHSFTRQSLDNGYIRFILQYTVPEALNISVFDPPNGDVFMLYEWNLRTSSERSTLQFDLSEEQLLAVSEFEIGFIDSSNNGQWIMGVDCFYGEPKEYKKLTYGNPEATLIGTPKNVRFAEYGSPQFINEHVHQASLQKLDDGMNRITLQLLLPEKCFCAYRVILGEELLFEWDSFSRNKVIGSGLSILWFDISDDETEKIAEINLQLTHKDNENDVTEISIRLNDDFRNKASVLSLPANLQRIEERAFENLSCEAVILPEACTYIGSRAFQNCTELKCIRLGRNVDIAPDAFDGCGGMWVERIPANSSD